MKFFLNSVSYISHICCFNRKPTVVDHAQRNTVKDESSSETVDAKANLQSKNKGFLDNYQYFTSTFPLTKEDLENEKEYREECRNEKEETKPEDTDFHDKLSAALKSLSESSKPNTCDRSWPDKENSETFDQVVAEEKENCPSVDESAETERTENHLPALELKKDSSAFQVFVRIRPLDDTGAGTYGLLIYISRSRLS